MIDSVFPTICFLALGLINALLSGFFSSTLIFLADGGAVNFAALVGELETGSILDSLVAGFESFLFFPLDGPVDVLSAVVVLLSYEFYHIKSL